MLPKDRDKSIENAESKNNTILDVDTLSTAKDI